MKISIYVCLALLLAYQPSALAEENGAVVEVLDPVDYLLERKREDIAENVHFDKNEEEKFWALYEEYENAIEPVLDEITSLLAFYRENMDTITEERANKLIDELLAANAKSMDVQLNYMEKARDTISAKKVLLVSFFMLTPSPL